MPWHDEAPWAAKRRKQEQQKAAARGKLEQIGRLVEQARVGAVSDRRALEQIEELASGEMDAIVRVGTVHTPEIQTGREDR